MSSPVLISASSIHSRGQCVDCQGQAFLWPGGVSAVAFLVGQGALVRESNQQVLPLTQACPQSAYPPSEVSP